MRLYAVLSDIHGNYEALRAVEEDARSIAQVEGSPSQISFICLGDVVNYGPQPNECMSWVCEHAEITISGNHERESIAPLHEPPSGVEKAYWPITVWTRQALSVKEKDAIHLWQTCEVAPLGLEAFTLFHSSLLWEDGYVDYPWAARMNVGRLDTPFGLFGHTHFQGYFTEGFGDIDMFLACPEGATPQRLSRWRPVSANEGWEPLPKRGRRAIFNPGSVGQPRHHGLMFEAAIPRDYRAAYMLLRLDTGHMDGFQFRRVDYNVERTAQLLRERVSWPVHEKNPGPDHNIHQGGFDPRQWHPKSIQMAEMLAHKDELLHELIEQVLVPTLMCK